ncbi:hypothetical protein QEN19_003202 [Hanseniaspora menglaensis]
MKIRSIENHRESEREMDLNFQRHQIESTSKYPSVVTDPDLKPIVLDRLPTKLNVVNFKNNYKVISCIGSGSFGTVQLCKKTSSFYPNYPGTMMDSSRVLWHDNYYNNANKLVAVKTMLTRLDNLSSYSRVRELKFIFNVPQHKNLLTVFECFVDDKTYKLHIALEVMDQNLYQVIKFRVLKGSGLFSHSTLRSILTQILTGLYHIHSHGFFHRDLKPENILISTTFKYYDKDYFQSIKPRQNYVVKIADYGLSRQSKVNNKPFTAYVSTRWYRSPEILIREKQYSKPIDIWAFGCVAFECATFTPLFPGSDEMDQIWRILELLGTPFLTNDNTKTGYIPHGGVWETARSLVRKLGIEFPYVEGHDISNKMFPLITNYPTYKKPNSNEIFHQLCEVIRNCLTWSPHERITIENLTQLSYFSNSEISIEHQNKVADEKKSWLLEQSYFSSKDSSLLPSSVLFSDLGTADQISPFNIMKSQVDVEEINTQKPIPISNVSQYKIIDPDDQKLLDQSFKGKFTVNGEYDNSFFDLYQNNFTKENSELSIEASLDKIGSMRTDSPLNSTHFSGYNSSSNYVFKKVSLQDTFGTDSSLLSINKPFLKDIGLYPESKKVNKHLKDKNHSKFNSNVFDSENFIINENEN